MAERAFITPLPRMAAGLVAAALEQAQRWHAGKPLTPPSEPLAVELQGLGFVFEFSAAGDGAVAVAGLPEAAAETVICASPVSLALQAANGQPGGRIEIRGDATLAQRWQKYFTALDPDWERGLSERLGPVLGFQLARALQQLLSGAQTNARHTGEMLGEYLQEESRVLVTRTEMRQFLDAVDELAERTERLLARHAAL